MTYLAHRHSTKSVFRFVPVIKQLLDHHKSRGIAQVSFNPADMGISLETGIARLRDAVYSLSSGLTTHPSVDATTLKEVWPLYKVSSDGINVLVVSRTTEQDEPVPIHTGSSGSLATLQVNDPQFVEIVTSFAVLLGRRFLQGQVTIEGQLSDNIKHQLESNHDVIITQEANNRYTMI